MPELATMMPNTAIQIATNLVSICYPQLIVYSAIFQIAEELLGVAGYARPDVTGKRRARFLSIQADYNRPENLSGMQSIQEEWMKEYFSLFNSQFLYSCSMLIGSSPRTKQGMRKQPQEQYSSRMYVTCIMKYECLLVFGFRLEGKSNELS